MYLSKLYRRLSSFLVVLIVLSLPILVLFFGSLVVAGSSSAVNNTATTNVATGVTIGIPAPPGCTSSLVAAQSSKATWTAVALGEQSIGTCLEGYNPPPSGLSTRTCYSDTNRLSDGSYNTYIDPITPQRTCIIITCPPTTDSASDVAINGNATWKGSNTDGSANFGTSETGTCVTGYVPSLSALGQRQCKAQLNTDGTYTPYLELLSASTTCSKATCPALSAGDASTGFATWPNVEYQQTSSGTCIVGYNPPSGGLQPLTCGLYGSIYRFSSIEASNTCSITSCPATSNSASDVANNGNATWGGPTNYNSSSTGSCINGYLEPTGGLQTRKCKVNIPADSDGIYTTYLDPIVTNTTCVIGTCPAITTPDGTNATWKGENSNNSTNYLQYATGTCDAQNGYITPTINGVQALSTRKCKANGSSLYFDSANANNTCVLVTCPRVTLGSSETGFATWAGGNNDGSTTFGSSATGTCMTGYLPPSSGSNPGTTPMSRKCEVVSNNPLQYGLSAITANSGDTCSPVTCAAVNQSQAPASANGYATWTSATFNNTSSGSCIAGYIATSTLSTRTCQADGTFGGFTGVCTPITCPNDGAGNATWTSATYGVDSVGNYNGGTSTGTCNAPYIAPQTPLPSRTCQAAGTLSSIGSSACIRITCNNDNAGNATWTPAEYGSSSSGTCNSGYLYQGGQTIPASGATSGARACLSTGLLASASQTCSPIQCPADNSTGNATWTSASYSPSPSTGSTSTGTCNPGYQGTLQSRYCNVVLSTTSVGLSGLATGQGCTAVPCQADNTTGNAAWSAASYGGTSTGTCLMGYSYNGDSTLPASSNRTCNVVNGSVVTLSNYTGPSCTANICPNDGANNATWSSTSYGGSPSTGTCAMGYGSPRVTCSGSNCTTSYYSSLENTRTCLASGQLSSAPASSQNCTKVPCGTDNTGNATWNNGATSYYGDTISGTCQTGYGLPTSSTVLSRTCGVTGQTQLTGTLSTPSASCSPITCANDEAGNAIWNNGNATSYLASASGQCKPGYSGTLPDTRTCNASGTTSAGALSPIPQGLGCNASSCGNDDYGNASWIGGVYSGASAQGACKAGFAPPSGGLASRSCVVNSSNGVSLQIPQDTSTITCQAITCSDDGQGNANWAPTTSGQSGNNASFTGTCKHGYQPAGGATSSLPNRTCGQSQSGVSSGTLTTITTATTCVPVTCPAVSAASSTSGYATWTGPTNVNAGSTGQCMTGYNAPSGGLGQRTCNQVTSGVSNGTLDNVGNATTCSPQVCAGISTAGANSTTGNATWTSGTYNGPNATGTCLSGFSYIGSGTLTASCQANGQLSYPSTGCVRSCDAITTGTESTGYATWTSATVGGTSNGTCIPNYTNYLGAALTATCNIDGSLTYSNYCVRTCSAVTTASSSTGYATWSQGYNDGTVYNGTCKSGYTAQSGGIYATCGNDGTFIISNGASCTPVSCPDDQAGHVFWSSNENSYQGISYGQTAYPWVQNGTYCVTSVYPAKTGYNITRTCQADGTLSPIPAQALCESVTCPNDGEGNATWTQAAVGQSSTGTCNSGYTAPSGGLIARTCQSSGQLSSVGANQFCYVSSVNLTGNGKTVTISNGNNPYASISVSGPTSYIFNDINNVGRGVLFASTNTCQLYKVTIGSPNHTSYINSLSATETIQTSTSQYQARNYVTRPKASDATNNATLSSIPWTEPNTGSNNFVISMSTSGATGQTFGIQNINAFAQGNTVRTLSASTTSSSNATNSFNINGCSNSSCNQNTNVLNHNYQTDVNDAPIKSSTLRYNYGTPTSSSSVTGAVVTFEVLLCGTEKGGDML